MQRLYDCFFFPSGLNSCLTMLLVFLVTLPCLWPFMFGLVFQTCPEQAFVFYYYCHKWYDQFYFGEMFLCCFDRVFFLFCFFLIVVEGNNSLQCCSFIILTSPWLALDWFALLLVAVFSVYFPGCSCLKLSLIQIPGFEFDF